MNAGSQGRDKRRHERIRIYSVRDLHNLSIGGAYVATVSPKRLGSTFHFELKLGHKTKAFHALARVVRVLHRPNHKIGEPAGMAIQFVAVKDEDRKILMEYLDEQKQRAAR
jgi:hypothetical protein